METGIGSPAGVLFVIVIVLAMAMIIGIINGNSWLFAFGLLFTVAAGGDMLILWLIRNVSSD